MPEQLEQSASGEISRILDEAIAEVLATMFFADLEPAPCTHSPLEHSWMSSAVSARVRFEGTHFGEAVLTISRPAAEEIASAFLGLDKEETSETDCAQVVLELANILCGSVLSRLWPESKLTLSAPVSDAMERGLEGPGHRCFQMPEGNLAWRLSVEGANR